MYTGKNPTAIRSKQWLSEALVSLMKEKQYAEISVKDICRRSDLSRQTFYQMFDSKEELARYTIQEKFLPLQSAPEAADFGEMSQYFIRCMSENREFIRLIQQNRIGYLLASELSQALSKAADRLDPGRSEKTKKVANAYITAGLTNSLLVWSQMDDLTEEELSRLLGQIIRGEYYKIRWEK